MRKLSERVRPNVEAAKWVVEEIIQLEDDKEILLDDVSAALKLLAFEKERNEKLHIQFIKWSDAAKTLERLGYEYKKLPDSGHFDWYKA